MSSIPTNPHDTIPSPPPAPPIEAGKARIAMAGAFLELLAAVNRAQALCDGIARGLDATAQPRESRDERL